ncbi:MAG: SIMPL domain-containing protein [Suilimivivens sp.]
MKKTIFILAMGIMMVGLSACQNKSVTSEESDNMNVSNTIMVNSSEKVSVVPDIAEVVYSVRTRESTASVCQQKNSESVSQVIELLKGLGVEEASIQTSDFYMNPIYSYSDNTQTLTGYEAITTLTVSDLPIDGLDAILSQSVSTGINTVQSITYQASQYDKSYQEALTKAVATAGEKAGVLAEASGAKAGRVISIQETSSYSDARYTDYARTGMTNSLSATKEAAMEDAAGIMPGEIEVEAGVIIEYQLLYE